MELIFPELEQEELQFKFDVIGGNPRRVLSVQWGAVGSRYFDPIVRVVYLVFGEEFIPTGVEMQTNKQELGQWAIINIVEELESVRAIDTNNSFFKEHLVTNNFKSWCEQLASTFLRLVASFLQRAFCKDEIKTLQALFAPSGINISFELTAHARFVNSGGARWCWKPSNEYVQLGFGRSST